MSGAPRSMHGVVPQTMTWYLPTFVLLRRRGAGGTRAEARVRRGGGDCDGARAC